MRIKALILSILILSASPLRAAEIFNATLNSGRVDIPYSEPIMQNLDVWYDASDFSTYDNSIPGVAVWQSKGLQTHITYQTNTAYRPDVVLSAFAGQYGVDFDGNDDTFLGSTTVSDTGTFDYWCVFESDETNDGTLVANGVTGQLVRFVASSNLVVRIGGVNNGFAVPIDITNQIVVLRVTRDSSNNMRAYFNGTQSSTGAINTSATINFTNFGGWNGTPGSSDEWNGRLYNYLQYSNDLSATEVAHNQEYYHYKYGVNFA